VRRNREIEWRGNTVYISQALAGEAVGLRESADGDWAVRYGPVHLGVVKHGTDRLRKPKRPVRATSD
jgi:hypothetical protein